MGTAKKREMSKYRVGVGALTWIHKIEGDADVRSIRSRHFEDGVSASWVIVDKRGYVIDFSREDDPTTVGAVVFLHF